VYTLSSRFFNSFSGETSFLSLSLSLSLSLLLSLSFSRLSSLLLFFFDLSGDLDIDFLLFLLGDRDLDLFLLLGDRDGDLVTLLFFLRRSLDRDLDRLFFLFGDLDLDLELDLRLLLIGDLVLDRLLLLLTGDRRLGGDLVLDRLFLDFDLDLDRAFDLERPLDVRPRDRLLRRDIDLDLDFLKLTEDGLLTTSRADLPGLRPDAIRSLSGLTIALLPCSTFRHFPPKITPLYCNAVGTDSCPENSMKACLFSPGLLILIYFISPTPEKKAISCSGATDSSISFTNIVRLISSISTGSVLLVITGGGGRPGIVPLVSSAGNPEGK